MGFLGAALFSLAFLFSVSATNAGFSSNEYALPNPFAPEKVVSVIDQAAADYSKALLAFLEPAREAVAVHMEGIDWISDLASQPIAQALGLGNTQAPQVAGAFVSDADTLYVDGSYGSLSVDDIYAILIENVSK